MEKIFNTISNNNNHEKHDWDNNSEILSNNNIIQGFAFNRKYFSALQVSKEYSRSKNKTNKTLKNTKEKYK